MRPIPSFNPANLPAGGSINLGSSDAGARILFYNESFYNIRIDFLNGNIDILHAWEARWWPLDGDTKEVDWTIDSTLSALAAPISLIMGVLYAAGEELPGTYPVQLLRLANIGNAINTVGGTAVNVQDDLRSVGSSTVEATVAGDAASAVVLTNSGSLTLGNFTDSRFASLLMRCGFGNVTIDSNGNLTLPNEINVKFLNSADGTNVMQLLDTGPALVAGALSFLAGALSRIKFGQATTGASGNVVVSHGLGAVPSAVLLTELNGINDTFAVTNLTSTTFQANVSVSGIRSFSWLALA